MNFQFRLAKVLHFIKLKETVKKMEVASIIQRINFLNKRVEGLQAGMRDLLSKHHEQLSSEWTFYHTSKIGLDAKEVSKIEALLVNENAGLEKKKGELGRLLMRKKSLENLKEKRLQEFKMQESRKQQRSLDDLYQVSQTRKAIR